MQNKKRGFTLVELLVVVIIVVLVVVFAVPSFKKAQENSKNQRAQAVLLDIAGAVKNFRVYEDPSENNGNIVDGQVTADMFTNVSNKLYILFRNNLLKPIQWDSDAGTQYNGYEFFICSDNFTARCCGELLPADAGADAVAAMQNTKADGRFGSGKCAWVNEQGVLQTTYNLETEIK